MSSLISPSLSFFLCYFTFFSILTINYWKYFSPNPVNRPVLNVLTKPICQIAVVCYKTDAIAIIPLSAGPDQGEGASGSWQACCGVCRDRRDQTGTTHWAFLISFQQLVLSSTGCLGPLYSCPTVFRSISIIIISEELKLKTKLKSK